MPVAAIELACLELPSSRRDPTPIDGLRQSRCFSHACLYPAGRCDTTKALKIKRNNVNRYARRRINKLAGNCTAS
jgi:hypothetical protein